MTNQKYFEKFEEYLGSLLQSKNAVLSEAMRYAALDGGKRVRLKAVFFGADSIGDCDADGLISLAAAVELIHSYSLVHDDLPSMDNDDYRRGKLSTHKRYGEAVGVLCGDQLLTRAMLELIKGVKIYGERYLKAAAIIAQAASDMADGQAYDIAVAQDLDAYLKMCSLKTAALIKSAFVSGVTYAGASDAQINAVSNYAEAAGLIFQLTDDLLDSDKNETSILTFESANAAQSRINDLVKEAVNAASKLPNPKQLIDFVFKLQNRTY